MNATMEQLRPAFSDWYRATWGESAEALANNTSIELAAFTGGYRHASAKMDDATITAALKELSNNVCGKLPEGWRIDISLERGSGWADLFNPKDELRDTGPAHCEESIAECVRRMVKTAIEIANPK